ncbi:fibrillarin-like rRNA/tRNA 2'-O-methyltransferase [Candidatus Woesearchaeota archaeon]|nr:fibrillarin-like rRNA/tRNA 2'-O-methyltransferase [Candidatus Woesearchaeota archaeon]
MAIKHHRLQGVFKQGNSIYTLSLNPGKQVYGEKLIKQGNKEFREWNPKKSKLGAGILKGISQIGIMPGKTVLYLGCSYGTTCSHVSDMVTNTGFVFGVDPAPRVMRDFYFLCQERKNMAPIMADANHPEEYSEVPKVDVVFQDIAQRQQVEIFLKNCRQFLKPKGTGILSVKARSIDVTKKPRHIFDNVRHQLSKEVKVVDYKELAPFEMDHCLFVIKL